MFVLFVLMLVVNLAVPSVLRQINIDFEEVLHKGKPLPRFWTSTGLCPPAPRQKSAEFLLSKDSLLNLEIIGSLPNQGLKYVRIHWLLEMIQFSHYDDRKTLCYDFSQLDILLDKLHEFGLYPGFEFMGVPARIDGKHDKKHGFAYFWTDLSMQIALRYLHRYGLKYVFNWRFETWNEPDLKGYNFLNFTGEEYISYTQSIRLGLDAAGRLFNNNLYLSLRGPAGLFKVEEHHPFCWSILKLCNDLRSKCPFDVLSFHRKGSGTRADEILEGGMQLAEQLHEKFQNLSRIPFSNDEADPIAGWSTPREFQSNVKYGSMLVSTVLQHWSALFNGQFSNLESISHDNGFLSYHPFEFDQRTLMARFEMNQTRPRHVQLIAKPVYSALGLLAYLGSLATDTTFVGGNLSYLVSYNTDPFYSCIILSLSNDTFDPWDKRITLSLNLMLPEKSTEHRNGYLVEAIQDGFNDPNAVWTFYGKPPYPTDSEFASMRSVQLPSILDGPTLLPVGSRNVHLSLNLRAPWIVTVRICSESSPEPNQITNVRVRTIFTNEVMIFWRDEPSETRCVVGYEIWFRTKQNQWMQINLGQYTPFMFYQFVSSAGVIGLYRVRSVDLFGRVGAFSKTHYYDG